VLSTEGPARTNYHVPVQMPRTRYARAPDGISIAYQVTGDGPLDLVMVKGYLSHLEMDWENPAYVRMVQRLGSFARVIAFDKRGVGMSDAVDELPTLEQRMDDVRVVCDEVGSERAVLFGMSEGGMMCILFAATYPERTHSLILYGAMARATEAPDYPWAAPREAIMEAAQVLNEHWGEGAVAEIFTPSIADEPGVREAVGAYERHAASPRAAQKLHDMFLDMDVRDVLPSVRVPTLVLHRRGDRVVNIRAGRWLASQIADARMVELDGIDHEVSAGDTDAIVDEIQEFVTGSREAAEPDRVLATVMFTDIVDSSRRASELGDTRWLAMLERHDAVVRHELERHRGREVKTTGDGFLATFDGPARAIRCALAITREAARVGTPVRVGLHTGEIELRGDDVAGIGVHIAARVSAVAGESEIVVSRTVKDLVVGSGIAFDPRGTHELKGIEDTWELFAVRDP